MSYADSANARTKHTRLLDLLGCRPAASLASNGVANVIKDCLTLLWSGSVSNASFSAASSSSRHQSRLINHLTAFFHIGELGKLCPRYVAVLLLNAQSTYESTTARSIWVRYADNG